MTTCLISFFLQFSSTGSKQYFGISQSGISCFLIERFNVFPNQDFSFQEANIYTSKNIMKMALAG
jgi:hypothetical protein